MEEDGEEGEKGEVEEERLLRDRSTGSTCAVAGGWASDCWGLE